MSALSHEIQAIQRMIERTTIDGNKVMRYNLITERLFIDKCHEMTQTEYKNVPYKGGLIAKIGDSKGLESFVYKDWL